MWLKYKNRTEIGIGRVAVEGNELLLPLSLVDLVCMLSLLAPYEAAHTTPDGPTNISRLRWGTSNGTAWGNPRSLVALTSITCGYCYRLYCMARVLRMGWTGRGRQYGASIDVSGAQDDVLCEEGVDAVHAWYELACMAWLRPASVLNATKN